MNFERFGGRTFLLTVGSAAINSLMRWFDHLDNSTYGIVISVTVGAYIAKSGWDEHTKTRADAQKSIAQAQIDSGNMPLGPR